VPKSTYYNTLHSNYMVSRFIDKFPTIYLEISCMLSNSTESGTPAGCAWPDMFLGWRTTLVLDLNPCFAMRDDPRTNDQVVDHYMHVDAIGTLYSLYSFRNILPCPYSVSVSRQYEPTYLQYWLDCQFFRHARTFAKMWSLQTGVGPGHLFNCRYVFL